MEFFEAYPEAGRVAPRTARRAGRKADGVSLQMCARMCEANHRCHMFEYADLQIRTRCILYREPRDEQGLVVNTNAKNVQIYIQERHKCADGTCNCPEFEGEDRHDEDCAAPLQTLFNRLPGQVIRRRGTFIEKFLAESIEECQRACVHYSNDMYYHEFAARKARGFDLDTAYDVKCRAVEYSESKGMCVLLSVRGRASAAADEPDASPTKTNTEYDLFNRDRMCDEEIPDDVFVAAHPMDHFQMHVGIRYGGRRVSTRASSERHCAIRCLAHQCMGFNYVQKRPTWGLCQYVMEIDHSRFSQRAGTTFYERYLPA